MTTYSSTVLLARRRLRARRFAGPSEVMERGIQQAPPHVGDAPNQAESWSAEFGKRPYTLEIGSWALGPWVPGPGSQALGPWVSGPGSLGPGGSLATSPSSTRRRKQGRPGYARSPRHLVLQAGANKHTNTEGLIRKRPFLKRWLGWIAESIGPSGASPGQPRVCAGSFPGMPRGSPAAVRGRTRGPRASVSGACRRWTDRFGCPPLARCSRRSWQPNRSCHPASSRTCPRLPCASCAGGAPKQPQRCPRRLTLF